MAIARDTGSTVKDSQTVLASVLANIVKATTEGNGRITLPNFGTFKRVVRKPRACQNPQTGEKMRIGTRVSVKFKVSTACKKTLTDTSTKNA